MRSLFCLLSLLLLVSCKNTSLTSINTGSDPTWAGEHSYEVLVAVQSYTAQTRVLFEQELVEALESEGVRAVPSFSVYPNVGLLNGDTFTKFLAADPTLAVLFIQAKSLTRQETKDNTEDSSIFSSLLGSDGWDSTFTAMMESGIYVHGKNDAVWWNRVRLEAKEDKVEAVAKQFVRDEIKAMKQGGAISRLK